jgi:hypothetical protein
MIKIGDRVATFENIGQEGVVVSMRQEKSNQWMVGGAMSGIFIATVQLDKDDSKIEIRADKLMRLE